MCLHTGPCKYGLGYKSTFLYETLLKMRTNHRVSPFQRFLVGARDKICLQTRIPLVHGIR